MIERQNQRLKRLSALWEQDFFNFDDVDGRYEIQGLKDQVMALNAQIKELQTVKKLPRSTVLDRWSACFDKRIAYDC